MEYNNYNKKDLTPNNGFLLGESALYAGYIIRDGVIKITHLYPLTFQGIAHGVARRAKLNGFLHLSEVGCRSLPPQQGHSSVQDLGIQKRKYALLYYRESYMYE